MKKLIFTFLLLIHINSFAFTPQELWHYDLKDMSFGNTCAGDIDGDGKLELVFSTYFNDHHIYALNAEDGTLLWKYDIKGCSDAAPIIYDTDNNGSLEVILHSSSVANIFCFNGKDGSLKWKIKSRATDSPPSIEDVDNDGIVDLFDGDFGGYVSRFDARNGDLIWETKVDTGIVVQTSPVIDDINNDGQIEIVVASYSFQNPCHIFALNSSDGEIIWKSEAVTDAIYHSPAIADIDNDGIKEIFVSDYDGILYCINAENGETIWTHKYPGATYSGTPVNIADIDNDNKYEILYFSNNKLIALDSYGFEEWIHTMENGQYSFRGAIITYINDDKTADIIFGDNRGGLTVLNGDNGSILHYLNFEEIYGKKYDLLHGPVAADFNNDGLKDIFFIGGHAEYPDIEKNYGRAYMYTLGEGKGLDWLMFRRNNKRNGVITIEEMYSSIEESNNLDINIFYSNNEDAIICNLGSNKEELNYIIYSIEGSAIKSGTIKNLESNFKIPIKNYTCGVYFLKLQIGREIQYHKVLIYK